MRNSNTFWHTLISSPITLVLALVLLVFLTRAAWNVHRSADVASAKLSQAQSEVDDLKAQQSNLSEKINYLSTPAGVETELRTKYRAVKQGESVAVIVGEDATTSVATSTQEIGWWGRVLQFVGL